jgi:hypothetical protein
VKFCLALLFLCLSMQAQAVELAGVGGLRSNDAKTDLANASITSKTAFQAGLLAWATFQGRIGGRSGFLYTQRHVELGPTQSGIVNFQFAYFDVPLTGTFRLGDNAWIFAGPILAFNFSKEVTCSTAPTCSALDTKSFILPLQLGIDFKFAPQVGGEVFYEYTSGELAKNLSNMSSVGANLLIFFE